MISLKCYTLTHDSLLEGIEVNHYDSIVADPCIERIDYACVQLIPVLDEVKKAEADDDFAKLASGSLTFICQEKDDSNVSKSGVLLSVNPKDWVLTYDRSHVVLLDPSGEDGRLLLYIQADTCNHIHHRRTNKSLSIDKDCSLTIQTTNRASLFLQALSLPAIKIIPPDNKHQSPQASSKKPRGNRRSNQQVVS